jgi:outer membrane protein assembly factor BamB
MRRAVVEDVRRQFVGWRFGGFVRQIYPRSAGHLYAQPLYWRPPRSPSGQLVVATEDDNLYLIDARSGREIWARSLGRPVALSTLPCGNIDPLGITGTPVIDEATQAIYLAVLVDDRAGRIIGCSPCR